MIDDINDVWSEIESQVIRYFGRKGSMNFRSRGMTTLEKEVMQSVFVSLNVFDSEFENKLQEIIESLFSGNAIFKQLKSIYNKYDEMISELGDKVDMAWERIIDSAREDMFARLEDDGEAEWRGETYADPYDIEHQDMFDYYNEEEGSDFFIDWFRQEISHNLENDDVYKKYIGDANSIPWDKLASESYPGHDTDYIIHKEIDGELKDQLDMTVGNISNIFKKIKAESNLPQNKQAIMDLIFTDVNRLKDRWQEI